MIMDRTALDDRMTTLLDPSAVEAQLRRPGLVDWPNGDNPRSVRTERYWPIKGDGFQIEWSLRLADTPRFSVYGLTPGKRARSGDAAEGTSPRLDDHGLRNLCLYMPEWKLVLHSPDRDPLLVQMATCLDQERMMDRLGAWVGDAHSLTCRLRGYRAGKRAAIEYQFQSATKTCSLLGKTYRGDKGRRLHDRHRLLGEQLALQSDRRIMTPECLDYLTDVKMVLFPLVDGRTGGSLLSRERMDAATEALALLHRSELADLPDFLPEDECTIIRRWRDALARIDHALAERAKPLVDHLLQIGDALVHGQSCTIHRDFYGGQMLFAEGVTTLLDLDTLAVGDPSVDLGNFLAHLWLDGLANGSSSSSGFELAARELIAAYERRNGTVDRRSLAFYCASALFRLGAVHAYRTQMRNFVPSLWEMAEYISECPTPSSRHASAGPVAWLDRMSFTTGT